MRASDTAYIVSKIRALLMCYPKEFRCYTDPVSIKLQSKTYAFALLYFRIPIIRNILTYFLEKRSPGMLGYYFSRFNYFETIVSQAIKNDKIVSVVNLGAGMDSRAYYLDGINLIQYFEVDQEEIIASKKKKLIKLFGKLPDHVIFVPIDFNNQDIKTELKKAGFKPKEKSLFILESVSPYLSSEVNNKIFKFLSNVSSGSKIVFSYISNSFLNGENINNKSLIKVHNSLIRKKKLLKHGFDPNLIEQFLSNNNLKIIEHLGPNETLHTFSISKNFRAIELERFILAEVSKATITE